MNERILEIAKLATQQYSMTYYPKEFMENFAKLIVQECIMSVSVIDVAQTKDRTYVSAEELIKEHFGIQQ